LTDAETLHESSLLCFGLLNLDLACEISLILSSLLLLQKIIDGVVFARHLGKQSLLISQFSHSAFVLVKMLILDFEIIGAQLWNFRNAFVLHILSVLVRVESLDLRIFLLHKVYLAHVHRRHKEISLHLRIRELLIQCLRHRRFRFLTWCLHSCVLRLWLFWRHNFVSLSTSVSRSVLDHGWAFS